MSTPLNHYQHFSSVFIGETSRGLSMPVFFDPHTSIVNNQPPVTLITGGPGAGKTFLALTLTSISAIMGKITVVLDPKADFLNLYNLKDEIGGDGNFTVWNLSQNQGSKAGLIDPFYMSSNPAEKLNLVVDVITIFLGGLKNEELSTLVPIIEDVMEMENPSLQRVVDFLLATNETEARNLGTRLDFIRKLPFAKLCFAPGTGHRDEISIDHGLTIITLAGLELPAAGEAPSNNKERLATGIFYLLSDFIRRIMESDQTKRPKTLVIDEAHALLSSQMGASMIKKLALLGRSRYLATVLITQNVSHLADLAIENTISTRFAFKSDNKEAVHIIKDMDLPTDQGIENIITELRAGECLMKDSLAEGPRYALVQISRYRDDWTEAFKTNPLDRIRKSEKNAQGRRRRRRTPRPQSAASEG